MTRNIEFIQYKSKNVMRIYASRISNYFLFRVFADVFLGAAFLPRLPKWWNEKKNKVENEIIANLKKKHFQFGDDVTF